MAPSPLPVPNATQPFWRTAPHPLDTHRTTPSLPQQVDIAIIGAGYAGASIAHHILKSNSSQSILILEAREACSGATGRNGGHLKPDPYNRPASLATTHSPHLAAECARFETATLSALTRAIADEGIACDLVRTRAVDALMTDAVHARFRDGYERLQRLGVLDDDVWYEGDAARAQQLSGVKGARACVSYSTAHLWPYKLVLGLLERAVASGRVNLQTMTPVVGVDTDEEWCVVRTKDRGSVRARKVVYATNGYTSSVLPEFEGRIVPVKGICSRIVLPEDKKPAPMLPHSYIMRFSATEYEYMVPRLDGSVIVGGARSRFYGDLNSWYDSVRDDALITAGDAHKHFDGYMQKHFRGWEDSGAYTESVWTGIMGYSADNFPFIGAVPDRKNQFVLAGFTGHGMPQIFLAAKGIAQMVTDDVDFAATGVPSLYQVTKERLASKKNAILDSWAAYTAPPAKL